MSLGVEPVTSVPRRAGFTLTEVIVVIALLGVLAAFAVPRFSGLEKDARVTTTLAVSGNVMGATAMAHSLWRAQSLQAVVMEGNVIDMTHGYPDARSVGDAIADLNGFQVAVNSAGSQAIFSKSGAGSHCGVTYNDAQPDQIPVIVTDVSGC